MNTSDTSPADTTPRPFGYWISAVDRLMAAEFSAAFEAAHASRREWRLLNIVDGTVPARRPLSQHKLGSLIERGWVTVGDDGWTLTDEGRSAKERLGGIVDGIRAKVSDAVSPDDFDTTMATLQQIALAFGWDADTPLPRRRGRRHGYGPRGFRRHGFGPHGFGPHARHHGFRHDPEDGGHDFRHDPEDGGHGIGGHGIGDHGYGDLGFGPGRFGPRGFRPRGFRQGFTPDDDARTPAEHHTDNRSHSHGHGHGLRKHGSDHAARAAQHAYERGFDAGFSRGRDA